MDLELYKQIVSNLSPQVTLRHDVDVSIHAAYEIAEIDTQMGVTSHFYFRTDYYAINHGLLHYIGKYHRVGLHISAWDEHDLSAKTSRAFQLYQWDGFTIHINDDITKTFIAPFYSGIRNDNICPNGYISDARGVMPVIPPEFKGVLNIHPEWWVYPGETPKDKLKYYFNQQYEKCLMEILPD
jgi:hypothetical protein